MKRLRRYLQLRRFERVALRWVNAERARLWGLAPLGSMPSGHRMNAKHCPLAHALTMGSAEWVAVGKDWYATSRRNAPFTDKHPIPDPVAEFIARVDLGDYPHLAKRKAGE